MAAAGRNTAEMAVDGGGLSQQYSAESRNKENMKRSLYSILGIWATGSEYSQICGFRRTFEILPSAVDNGFLGRGMNADHVSGFQELCDRPREAGRSAVLVPAEGTPAKKAKDICMALPP